MDNNSIENLLTILKSYSVHLRCSLYLYAKYAEFSLSDFLGQAYRGLTGVFFRSGNSVLLLL